jgi:hypothetical protein
MEQYAGINVYWNARVCVLWTEAARLSGRRWCRANRTSRLLTNGHWRAIPRVLDKPSRPARLAIIWYSLGRIP